MMMKVMKTTRLKKKKTRHSCKSWEVSYSSAVAGEANDDQQPRMLHPDKKK
tara:strand:- start:3 stop:155 length:153 start_codon:yes stop_codon:yes gene_type:complete